MVTAMAISCAYCGGEHDSPAQIRQCWNDGGRPDVEAERADVATDVEAFPPTEFRAAPNRPTSRPRREVAAPSAFPRGVAAAQAGPDVLGRHALVPPGGAVPAPWSAAERIRITAATLAAPAEACNRLRRAANDRERLVLELDADFEQPPSSATSEAPFDLGPRFGFELDELHHLVWSNTVDLRAPDRPTWIGLDLAVAAGATAGSAGDAR